MEIHNHLSAVCRTGTAAVYIKQINRPGCPKRNRYITTILASCSSSEKPHLFSSLCAGVSRICGNTCFEGDPVFFLGRPMDIGAAHGPVIFQVAQHLSGVGRWVPRPPVGIRAQALRREPEHTPPKRGGSGRSRPPPWGKAAARPLQGIHFMSAPKGSEVMRCKRD